MDYREKINIYIPLELKALIQNDAMYFEIFKKNHRGINLNRFLSLFLCGYHDRYIFESNKSSDSIINILKEHNLDELEQIEISDRILKEIILPTESVFQNQKNVPISLKPTTETERILIQINSLLGGRDTMSQYIRRMLISYSQKAMWQREQIIFNDTFQFIQERCKNKQALSFSLIWGDKELHDVIPYKIASGTDGMFNYLICIETNQRSGIQEIRSYRLNRITGVGFGQTLYSVSKELEMLCKKTLTTAPQYAINSNVEICVRLNDYGEELNISCSGKH